MTLSFALSPTTSRRLTRGGGDRRLHVIPPDFFELLFYHHLEPLAPRSSKMKSSVTAILLLVAACCVCLAWGAAASSSHMPPMDHKNHKDHEGHDDMGDMDMGDMDMDMDNKSHHMMMMYFHFGVKETVLFKEWEVTNAGGMVASVIGVFLMAMLYEGLKYFREYLFKQYISTIQFSTVAIKENGGKMTQVHKVEQHRMVSLPHTIQTGLHVVQIIVSYFLMLIFMTYNVWLCLGVVLGAGVGYFIFGWKKASVVDITEHCH